MNTVVLDFSGVYEQERLAIASEHPFFSPGTTLSRNFDNEVEVIDFNGLAGTNCYCDAEAQKIISDSVGRFGSEDAVHWIDTGDYHYLTKFFLDRIREPFCLLLIDHHSDEQDSAFGCLSCGSWVADSKKANPYLKQVISIGPARTDNSSEGQAFPTRFLPESATVNDIQTSFPLYISVDLDVLSCSDFSTDWDQGTMSLSYLENLLNELRSKFRIIGTDICGGKTSEKGASDCELSRNFAVRSRLLKNLAH